MKNLILTIISAILFSSTVLATTDNSSDNFTIPHGFSSGETISSSKMNENFNQLINKIRQFEDQISNLESKLEEQETINLINSLQWQGYHSEDTFTGVEAEAYCSNLTTGGYGEIDDWRLPTEEEMETIIRPNLRPAIIRSLQFSTNGDYYLVGPAFDNSTNYYCYELQGNSGVAGNKYNCGASSNYVRCVRDKEPATQ